MRVAGIPICGGTRGDEHQNVLTKRYNKVRSRSHVAVIRVYDAAGNVIETHEHAGAARFAICVRRSRGLFSDQGCTVSRYITLLRAINVGRGRTVRMEVLRQLFESIGFSNVATFIASGNVVFEATTKNVRSLEERVEKRLEEALGYEVAAFIRTEAELVEVANYKPFPQSKVDTAAGFNIIFLADTVDENSKEKVLALRTDTDEFHVHGREIYWLRRQRQSGSRFSTVPLEKTLGRPFTIRGGETIKRMVLKFSLTKP